MNIITLGVTSSPSSLNLTGTAEGSNGPINGVQIDLWKTSRFTTPPQLGDPIPNDSLPADAGPVTSGTQYGSHGSWRITVTSAQSYYIRAYYEGINYWQETDDALILNTDPSGAAAAVQANLTSEIARAENVESGLQTQISQEVVRAENAENALTSNLSAETIRAEAAEALLAPKASPTFTGVVTTPAVVVTGLSGAVGSTRWVGVVSGAHPTTGTWIAGDWVVDKTSGGFWICTVGGTPGTWVSPSVALPHTATEGLNVLDFGAVGDNVTDDHDAILAGMIAANAYGQDLFFPQTGSSYLINSPLGSTVTTFNGVKLIGEGYRSKSSTIRAGGNFDIFQGRYDKCKFENLSLDGNNGTGIPLNIWMNMSRLESLYVKNWAGAAGIALNNSSYYNLSASGATISSTSTSFTVFSSKITSLNSPAGISVTISGANVSGYNRSWTVASVNSGVSFTVTNNSNFGPATGANISASPGTGLLCSLKDVYIDDGPAAATGALRSGIGLNLDYLLTDSYMEGGTIGNALANVQASGGPFRFTDVHFDGNPDYNFILIDTNTISIGSGCILENTQRESIVLDRESFNSSSGENRIMISGGVIQRGASAEGTGIYPVFSIRGVGSNIKSQSHTISGNSMGKDPTIQPSRVVELVNTDITTLNGNVWDTAHAATDPVLAIGATRLEVFGNAGDNGIAGAPSDPSTLQGITLAGWWKPESLSTGSIASWTDSSGKGHNFTQGTPARQPVVSTGTNGYNAAQFTASSSHYLSTPDNADFDNTLGVSWHAVISLSTQATGVHYSTTICKGTGPQFLAAIDSSLYARIWYTQGGATQFLFNPGPATPISISGWYVISGFYDGYMGNGCINGKIVTNLNRSVGAMNIESLPVYMGCSGGIAEFWDGKIAEALITNGPISRGNHAAIDAYLMNKFGITPS